MRILITGATGFFGSNLIELIHKIKPKWNITGIDIVKPKIEDFNFRKIDLSREFNWDKELVSIEPDIIFHLAGVYGIKDYNLMYNVNTLQTFSMLASIKKAEIDARIIIIGSAAQYGRIENNQNPINEKFPQNPFSIYGATKKWQEEIALFYHKTYGLKVVCTRPSNLIGKSISKKLLPGYLSNEFLSENKKVNINISSLEIERDYIDVRDASNALIKISEEKSCIGNTFNISRSKGTSNGELVEIFEKIAKKEAMITLLKKENEFSISLDNEKIKKYIKWDIEYTLEDSVKWSLS